MPPSSYDGVRRRWIAPVVALGAGAATALSLAPWHLLPFAIGHAVLLAVVSTAVTARSAAWRAWFWALGYHIAGLHWISNAMLVNAGEHAWLIPFANLGLPAVLALFAALAGGVAKRLFDHGWPLWLGLAALYTATEWLRGHLFTGFPWNLPSATIDGWLPLLQAASLVGSYGLSFLVVLISTVPALWLSVRASRRSTIAASAFSAFLLVAMIGWGTARLTAIPLVDEPGGSTPGVVVRIVQGNVPQREKWDPLLKPDHLGRYFSMSDPSRQADIQAPGLGLDDRPTVTVWPETAVAHLLADAQDFYAAIARIVPENGSLVFGAPRLEEADGRSDVYNSVFAVDSRAQVPWIFDKAHLVPFGEYVPLRSLIPMNPLVQSRRDFTPGPGPRTLALEGAPPVSLLICYEAIFPGGAVDPAERPAWLLNATNDAWFGRRSGPFQHLAIARLRSIEQGLPMVRAANTGISTVIDPAGRIVASIGMEITGSLDSPLPAALEPTPFSFIGDIPLFLMVVIALAIAAFGRFRDRRRTAGN